MALILAYQGNGTAVVATDLQNGRERLARSANGVYYFAFPSGVPPFMEHCIGALTLDRLVKLGFPSLKHITALRDYADYSCIILNPKTPQLYFRSGKGLDVAKVDKDTAVLLFDKKVGSMTKEHSLGGKNPEDVADFFIDKIQEFSGALGNAGGYDARISQGSRVLQYANSKHRVPSLSSQPL